MKVLSRLALALALAGGAVVAAPALVTPSAPTRALLSLDQMTDAADLVVRGTVLDSWADLDPNGNVITYANIRVTEGMKGAVAAGDFLTVETPGGELDGTLAVVEGAARYDKDEEVVLFLAEKRFGTSYGTVGLWLGKFTVKPNPRDGQDMVVRFTVPWGQRYDARFLPNPPADQRMSVAQLAGTVRSRVALGWDGKAIPGVSAAKLRTINKLQPGVR